MPGLNVGFRIVQGALFSLCWEKFFFAVLLYLRNRKENGLC